MHSNDMGDGQNSSVKYGAFHKAADIVENWINECTLNLASLERARFVQEIDRFKISFFLFILE